MLLMFPGQGSHYVGMGKGFCQEYGVARQVFEEVNNILGFDFSNIMFEGPEQLLMLTYNSQPAIMSSSLAILRVLCSELGEDLLYDNICYVAGHSLGEYSALCAARSISLNQSVSLLRLRGEAMYKAFPEGGGMVACLGVKDFCHLEKLVSEQPDCFIANDNGAGQVVLSGRQEALDMLTIKLKKVYRVVKLNVQSPFHCKLIREAENKLAPALHDAEFLKPVFPLISNVTAKVVSDIGSIKKLLLEQVYSRVRWRETIQLCMDKGIKHYLEIGGTVLSNLIVRMDRSLNVYSIKSVDDLRNLVSNKQLVDNLLSSKAEMLGIY